MQFFAKSFIELLLIGHNYFCILFLKGAQIPRFSIFERPVEFLFFINFNVFLKNDHLLWII